MTEIKTQLQSLSAKEISMFLNDKQALVGRLATVNENGFPYVVPVHFVYYNGKIYIHGASKGQKINNINRNAKVGFEAEFMDKIYPAPMPCKANTTYTSVIAAGAAQIVANAALKHEVLELFVAKYLPEGVYEPMPDEVVAVTAVIEITITEISAKARIVSA